MKKKKTIFILPYLAKYYSKNKNIWKSVFHNDMNPLSKFKKKSVTYPRPRSDGSAWIDPIMRLPLT
jgi:hypothetical protein